MLMAVALALSCGQVLSQPRLFQQPNQRAPVSAPVFMFAPANGAGMGAACACTTPTGAKGEAVTFTRASSAYCTKGNEWSSIANGDMVQCSNDLPLVMPGGDGTGALGTLEEDSGSSVVTNPEDFTNAAWANFTAGAGTNPAKGSANTDVAPNNATTAEMVTFGATGAADSSALSQTVLTAAAYSCSGYARGNATTASGTTDICIDTAGAATCAACSYVLGSWTRCFLENITSKASGKFYVGNLSSLNGGTVRAAQTPTLWGFQCEAKAIVTSYMGTGGTRASSRMLIPANIPPGGVVSWGATMMVGPTNFIGETPVTIAPDISSSNNVYQITSTPAVPNVIYNMRVASVSSNLTATDTPATMASNAFWSLYDGTTQSGCRNGACTSALKSFAPFTGAVTVAVGRRGTAADTFHANRVVKQVCIDSHSPSLCPGRP